MKVIVVAENLTQFRNYVKTILNTDIKPTIETMNRTSRIMVSTEPIEYIWVYNVYQIMGMSFTKQDKLIFVGTWYKLPNVETIENAFIMRKEQ